LSALQSVFAGEWIERGPEGPALSRYRIHRDHKSFELSFRPQADADDGLVALASLISKSVRESWMDVFNGYWKRLVPDLRPTAGYPNDAMRFRRQIEGIAIEMGLEHRIWWRER
jgi:hypothetical protein